MIKPPSHSASSMQGGNQLLDHLCLKAPMGSRPQWTGCVEGKGGEMRKTRCTPTALT